MSKTQGPLRIKFVKHAPDKLVSHHIYSDGKKMVKLTLNPVNMGWAIIDAATGYVYESGGSHITNFEVLQRNAKKALSKFIGIKFEREQRSVGKSK